MPLLQGLNSVITEYLNSIWLFPFDLLLMLTHFDIVRAYSELSIEKSHN